MPSRPQQGAVAPAQSHGARFALQRAGDAPGDLKAARDNNALFCPINPGREDESWERFFKEGLPRFFSGTYAGDYEASLVAEFDRLLPDTPPWKRK